MLFRSTAARTQSCRLEMLRARALYPTRLAEPAFARPQKRRTRSERHTTRAATNVGSLGARDLLVRYRPARTRAGARGRACAIVRFVESEPLDAGWAARRSE